MVWVTKADGTTQEFRREKVINTCLRMRASQEVAETIADKIESRIYDGIPTKKILQMLFKYLKKHAKVKHQIDLRTAISFLRSKPDFERFVQMLLEEMGYTVVAHNQIVRGKCVEHEIDVIAQKGEDTYLVEIKHHRNSHTYTGLDIPRIAQATLEDLIEGFNLDLNSLNFAKALIVCNTKFSDHAIQYATCRGIKYIGWKAPPNRGLEWMIGDTKFYPITMVKELTKKNAEKLINKDIILLKQLITYDASELGKKTRIPKNQLEKAINTAKALLLNS